MAATTSMPEDAAPKPGLGGLLARMRKGKSPGLTRAEQRRELPPVWHDPEARLYNEEKSNLLVTNDRLSLMLALSLLIIVVLGYDNYRMHSTTRFDVVEVYEGADGLSARRRAARAYEPTENQLRSAIGKFAESAMVIDPHYTLDNYRRAISIARGPAADQLQAVAKEDKAFARMHSDASLNRSVLPGSVSVDLIPGKERLAVVELKTLERRNNAEPLTESWRFTFKFGVIEPETAEEALANPSGLVITHIVRNKLAK